MQKSYFLCIAYALFALLPIMLPWQESPAALLSAYEKSLATPLPPDTGDLAQTTGTTTGASTTAAPAVAAPTRLRIPSIGLNDAIIKVGLNAKGEMDVPDGSSSNVGWYAGGTMPGMLGSAVLDAHVFAAFAKLKNVTAGSDLYVETDSGQKLHFAVSEIKTYALADVPADRLFNRADTERLNLITCAGNLTPDRSTYDHRLVIYATLVHND